MSAGAGGAVNKDDLHCAIVLPSLAANLAGILTIVRLTVQEKKRFFEPLSSVRPAEYAIGRLQRSYAGPTTEEMPQPHQRSLWVLQLAPLWQFFSPKIMN